MSRSLGWLGWLWKDVRDEDVNILIVALEGRIAMLAAIFGGSEPKPARAPMTNETFRGFVDRHNRRYAGAGVRRRRRGE